MGTPSIGTTSNQPTGLGRLEDLIDTLNPVPTAQADEPAAQTRTNFQDLPETAVIQDLINPDIPLKGIPLEPHGHCQLITPLISEEAADNVSVPGVKQFVKGTSKTLSGIDWAFDQVFYGAARVDEEIFAKRLDHVTGVADLDEPYRTHTRWLGERLPAAALTTGAWHTYRVLKNPEYRPLTRAEKAKLVWQKSKGTAKAYTPLGLAFYLSATGLPATAAKALDLIDPDNEIFRNEHRQWARAATYATFIGGSALALNLPADSSYRAVVAPQEATKAARLAAGKEPLAPFPLKWGLAAAVGYGLYDMYWSNFSAQQRILPAYSDLPPNAAYNPLNWDWDKTQGHTAASHMLMWGATGAAWSSLLRWQNGITNKVMKRTFGYGNEILSFTEAERHYVQTGAGAHLLRHPKLKPLRAMRTNFLSKAGLAVTGKRHFYTALSTLVGLPTGIGIGKIMYQAQAYSSKEATAGTPIRAVITSPLSTLGMNTFASMGKATPWQSYAFNMIPVNYLWSACSQQNESLKQVAVALADDYKTSDDPQQRLETRTHLYNLYRLAYDNGKDVKENEKLQIEELMEGAGIDVEGVEEYVATATAL